MLTARSLIRPNCEAFAKYALTFTAAKRRLTLTNPPRTDVDPPTVSSGGAAAAGGLAFQAQLGTFLGLGILSQRPVDHVLGLGDVRPVWMRFETEAPVDDILVATSAEGFIAIQAKTSVNLSAARNDGLAKTVQQFVRHWLVCRDGEGTQLWDRPLDPQRDRLVLAVGPNAPASIRTDLPAALRLCIQPGTPALTQAQTRALEVFTRCAEAAWRDTTSEPWTPVIVSELARLIHVWPFDPDGVDGRLMEMIATGITAPDQSRALINALRHLSERWMTERGGADLVALRHALMQERIALAAPPCYADDIRVLQKHSREIAAALERYESIDQGAGTIQISRECQNAVLAAAEGGSLLIIGEPGAGKSAVINTLARDLRGRGDVVELGVDRYNVNDLEGLRDELGLKNNVVNVLEAWDGPTDGWLIIDALDATRGGRGEGAFRGLIERVMALKGRWKVVASIRTFDLRMGIRFRELFPGQPPDEAYRDPSFSTVRHVLVPPWSPTEFAQVLIQAPALGRALEGAPAKLRDLAEVPFNTRLINELLQSGVVAGALRDLANQAGLLRLYWDHRIAGLGSAAEACLRRVVQNMVEVRALRVRAAVAAEGYPEALDALYVHAVLIRVENGRYVQFRHHLLFDYVASRLLLDADGIVSGRDRFPKSEAEGLMLAPSLGFLLQELWASEVDRCRYWKAVEQIVSDSKGDPILRSTAGRLSAELPEAVADTTTLALHVDSGNAQAIATLGHIIAALAVRIVDDPRVEFAPWVALAGALARNVQSISHPLRILVHLLLNTAKPPRVSAEVGIAARALLRDAFDREGRQAQAASLIPFVVTTFASDPVASRVLLDTVFDLRRFTAHGWEDVPALCREIGKLALTDPGFAAHVYTETYARDVNSDETTRLMDSRILSFTSNQHQDYSMARYSLSEFFPEFLRGHPVEAVEALVSAAEGFVARVHPPREREEQNLAVHTISGRRVRLKPDMSYIWANDMNAPYAQDGEALVAKFLTTLVALPKDEARLIAEHLVSKTASAILWSRLFHSAIRRRDDGLVEFLWPIAASEAWIVEPDTRKDAIDVVTAGYARRTYAEKQALEQAAFTFDLSRFADPLAAKDELIERLFSAIGADQLVTVEARSRLAGLPVTDSEQANDRLFRVNTGWSRMGTFDWIQDLDRSRSVNARMMTAIEEAQAYFGLGPGQSANPEIETWQGLSVLDSVARDLLAPYLDPGLRRMGEGVIAQGCARLAAGRRLVAEVGKPDPADRFAAFIRISVDSENPSVDVDTENRFEESQAWGFPAARVDAAIAALDVCLQRPDLYPILKSDIDRLLDDKHPATRLQAAAHLIRLWDIDRDGFWDRLADRLSRETNFGVLEAVVDELRRVLHADPAKTETQLLAALNRFNDTNKKERLAELAADLFAILAVTYSSPNVTAILDRWIAEPVVHKGLLGKIVMALRGAVTLGLHPDQSGDIAVRHRAQALFQRIVLAASVPLARLDPNVAISDEQGDALRACMKLLDIAGTELYFATGRPGGGTGNLSDIGYATFLEEVAPTIERIGGNASPHTVYHLMLLIEVLAPYGAAKAFDLTAYVIRAAAQGGYQYESLGADLMVRLVGTFLADNKEIFADEARRQALVSCLEIFMEAGWPAAQRLLYRLPELIQ